MTQPCLHMDLFSRFYAGFYHEAPEEDNDCYTCAACGEEYNEKQIKAMYPIVVYLMEIIVDVNRRFPSVKMVEIEIPIKRLT